MSTQNILITFVQHRPNVFEVGPMLYKCYKNVLCLLGLYHLAHVHPAYYVDWVCTRSPRLSRLIYVTSTSTHVVRTYTKLWTGVCHVLDYVSLHYGCHVTLRIYEVFRRTRLYTVWKEETQSKYQNTSCRAVLHVD